MVENYEELLTGNLNIQVACSLFVAKKSYLLSSLKDSGKAKK